MSAPLAPPSSWADQPQTVGPPAGGRVLLATFALTVLAMAGAGVWFYHTQYQLLQKDTEANLEAIAGLKVDQITQWRHERLANASMLMGNTFLKEAIAKWMEMPDPVATEGLLAFFRAEHQFHAYQDASLVDVDGRVRLSLSGNLSPLHDEAARTLAATLRDRRPALSELHVGPGDPAPHLEVMAPLFVEGNGSVRAIGAVRLQCDARQFLYPLIKSWPVGSSTAETVLVRRDGDAVLYLNDLRHQADTALQLRLPLTRTDLPAIQAVINTQKVFYGKDYRGVPVLAVFKAIPDSPWFLVAKVDAREAFASWRFRSGLILALVFGSVLAAAVVAGLIWQRKEKFNRYARSLIEASLDPLVAISPSGKITDVNTATEAATGCTRTELIGTDFTDYCTEPEKARAGYEQVFLEGSVRDYPLELRHRDGRLAPVLYNASVYRNELGKVIGVFAAARDITGLKRAEDALRRLNRELRAIGNCHQTLIRAEDEQTLLNDICRIACEEADYRMAWVGYAENDDAKSVHPEAWSGSEEGYLANANISWADTERGRGPIGTAIRTGKTICVQDFMTAPEFAPWREKALQCGFLSCIALPLQDENGKTFGALTVYSSEAHAFPPEEIRILEELAVDLAFGITVLRARRERKRVEEEKEKYFRFFRLSTDAMCICDPDGCFKQVNPAFVKLLGYSETELISQPYLEFVHPDDRQKTAEEMERQVNVRPSLDFENRYLLKDGSAVFLSWTAYFDRHDGVTYGTARNITDRRQREEEIRKLNQSLEKRVADRTAQLEFTNKELESFAYSVSHDLRAPLRSIDGFSRILQEDYADKLDENGKKNLATVRAASQRMAQLIDDILQLSRLSRTPLRLATVDLSALAASVADDLKKADPDRRVEFVIEPGCLAFADGNLMRIVLENLLGNAWKFTGNQGAAKIEFGRATCEDASACFVRDNGVGFDMQYASKLFSAFQRLHTTAEFPGTGIGLATVQRVIHRHGGKVWIEGRIAEGATVYFTIPQTESGI